MSDIFYSELDKNLQAELDARANAAKRRSTGDLNFMLGKIANVTLTPYKTPEKKEIIESAVYGGTVVRGGKYLPSGKDGYLSTNEDGKFNRKLLRTPPYITSAEIAIGDHSMGLLNTATVNLTIPDPDDIEFVEAIYFRPGRCVEVTFEHEKSACILNTDLSPTTLPSLDKIANSAEYPNLKQSADFNEKYRKIYKVTFEGLITSFNFNYQSDLSVTATLTMRGTSNVYPEVSLMINQATEQPEKVEKPKNGETKTEESELDTFYSGLKNIVESEITKQLNFTAPPPHCKAPPRKGLISYYNNKVFATNNPYLTAVIGSPTKTKRTEQQYITLAWLVNYINEFCLSKLRTENEKSSMPSAYIIFNSDVCKSNYYSPTLFKSSNPERIFFTDMENRTYEHKDPKKNLVWYGAIDDIAGDRPVNDLPPFKTPDGYYTPASIMINLNVIEEITKKLKEEKSFTIGELLKRVSDEVYAVSGHAIELTLTTHPEDSRFLIWYDSKFIIKPGPQPYYVPMTSNDPAGQIVREFEFSGKLPDSAAHLSYALNQDISNLSESDIAPFVSYLYAQESNPNNQDENVKKAIEKYENGEEKTKAEKEYAKAHFDAVVKLTETIQTYATEATAPNSAALGEALQKFIQFPADSLKKTNDVAAPVIPFDTSFTIDGINGFKYGDVVMFRILPSRYVKNTVFSVINVTHTVANDGQWTTTVRSIMRPKFD
jgi:hypothetical protein